MNQQVLTNQVIELEEWEIGQGGSHILWYCPVCGTKTKYVLTMSREFYACGCGTILDIEVIEGEQK